MPKTKSILLACLLFTHLHEGKSQIIPSQLFGSDMVLQRNKPVAIWGKANPGEKIVLEWNNLKINTKALPDSTWKLILPAQKEGGPFVISLKGKNALTWKNVFFGDVWIASGQSNMEWKLRQPVKNNGMEISQANYPQIRFLDIKNRVSLSPKKEIETDWG
jgi:sialate O-acetylesterase